MDDEEVRRRFAEISGGLTIDGLRAAMEQVGRARLADYLDRDRPELRHPPRPDTVSFRVRADLVGAKPPIWRRLDLRSSMTLDALHEVLQAAFGWTDSHLHRFSIGGDGWDRDAQLFLCPFDVDEGEDEGVPASEVRLDEAVAQPRPKTAAASKAPTCSRSRVIPPGSTRARSTDGRGRRALQHPGA